MSKEYFNLAFEIAFEVVSERDDDCRAEDMIEALKQRVREMEENLKNPDVKSGYYDERNPSLVHIAAGAPYDCYFMTEDEMRKWKAERNIPIKGK